MEASADVSVASAARHELELTPFWACLGTAPVLVLFVAATTACAAQGPPPPCVQYHLDDAVKHPDSAAETEARIRRHPSLISRDEAIARAETFVRAAGFTDAPATVGPDTRHRDIMEVIQGETFEQMLASRRDRVVPKAVGARRGPRYWKVAFPFTARVHAAHPSVDLTRGAAVLVTLDGQRAWMMHQDTCLPLFDEFTDVP
jgi:hypothetical protein